MAEYFVERQCWTHWPKVLVMCRKHGDGIERRRYVPDRGTCHNVHEPPRNTEFWPTPHFKCSECAATHVSMDYVFYCPWCGRKVVEQ